MIHRS